VKGLVAALLVASLSGEQPLRDPTAWHPRRMAATVQTKLFAGTKYAFELKNVSKDAEPAILVLDADDRPLAWNDDWPKPRLEFIAPRRAAYRVQVRARQGTLEGQCDLFMNGKPLATKLHFGARK
jgi:hypothetical protein